MIISKLNSKIFGVITAILAIVATGCSSLDNETLELPKSAPQKRVDFDVTVTRDGLPIPSERSGVMTRSSSVNASDNYATMDPYRPFGLIGIDLENHKVLLDNQQVFNNGTTYSGWFATDIWGNASRVTLSAYYPYVNNVSYVDSNEGYSIPFAAAETDAGPLVSKTMQKAIDEINKVPLEFQHITNDIGYKVCDATPSPELQGLIHLRKLTAYNVASAGTFVNNLSANRSFWQRVGYYRNVVVFEGDVKVGVGSENEKFVGFDTLEDKLADSHRYYSIPDEIQLGKQFVEVVYDVESFTIGDYTYPPLKEQVAKYSLYGLIPDNIFANGKQYTFHIGLDLSSVYREITFVPSVGDWETKIYENNDDF